MRPTKHQHDGNTNEGVETPVFMSSVEAPERLPQYALARDRGDLPVL